MTDPILPNSIEAERAVLGACILNTEQITKAHAILRSSDFYLQANAMIFKAMTWMVARGMTVDLITLSEIFKKEKKLTAIGGVAYLASLTEGVPYKLDVKPHAEIVVAKSKARRLIKSLEGGLAKVNDGADPESVIADVEAMVMEVSLRGRTKEDEMSDVSRRVFQRIYAIKNGLQDRDGLTTSIPDLDELTGGAHEGEYIILAGRTGHGKSSLARQIALANAKAGKKVLVCNLEMTTDNTVECMIATESGVDFSDIRDPQFLKREELEKVAEASKFIASLPVVIDDTAGISAEQLASRIRAHIMRGVDLVIVDYLQLIDGASAEDAYKRVTRSSAVLRELAKTTKVPIIALSQLRRPEQGSENREPTIYDLKECGNIENDAFQVWLIYRPKEKKTVGTESHWEWTGEDRVIIGKDRNGPLGWVAVTYDGPHLFFKPREKPKPLEPPKEPRQKVSFMDAYKQESLNVSSGSEQEEA